jgi:His-Xaa-Ser system protein HxsD
VENLPLNITPNKKDNAVYVTIDPKIYSMSVIYTACYVLIDRAYVHIEGLPEYEIKVELRPKETYSLEKLGKEFENELVKHAFFQKQHNEALGVKVLMLKRILAMSDDFAEIYADKGVSDKLQKADAILNEKEKMSVPKTEEIEEDFWDDPEGIAIPWEEKYGKKEKGKQKKPKRKK